MVQKRAPRAIFPGTSYNDILSNIGAMTLHERRVGLCLKYFNALKSTSHKLHHLLPDKRTVHYSLRSVNDYPLIKCRTNRYQKSLIPWCLSHQ